MLRAPLLPFWGSSVQELRRPRFLRKTSLSYRGAPGYYPETIRIHPTIPSSRCIYVNATGRQRTCRLRGGLTDSDPQAALSQAPFPAPTPVLTVHPFLHNPARPPLPAAPKPEPPSGLQLPEPSPWGLISTLPSVLFRLQVELGSPCCSRPQSTPLPTHSFG